MSKQNKKTNKSPKKKQIVSDWIIAVGAVLVLFAAAIGIWWLITGDGVVIQGDPNSNQPTISNTDPNESTNPFTPTSPEEENEYTDIGDGLSLSKVHKYAGVYMEDGSDEPVSNTMMVILRNDSGKDLQLARIEQVYPEYTAEFEATNLPAGESVVLLEKNRRSYTEDPYEKITTNNVTFFPEPMSVMKGQVQIVGEDGYLEVKNITDQPMGLTYVYYKNSASDLFYGGITYRTKIESIQPGEFAKGTAAHYDPQNSKIVMVQTIEEVTE